MPSSHPCRLKSLALVEELESIFSLCCVLKASPEMTPGPLEGITLRIMLTADDVMFGKFCFPLLLKKVLDIGVESACFRMVVSGSSVELGSRIFLKKTSRCFCYDSFLRTKIL